MNSLLQLQDNLLTLAERSIGIKSLCANEEGTKQYLVLPALAVLGYDCANPYEVQPEYPASFRDGVQDRTDYVILRNGEPLIAIECKKYGTDLQVHRGQLRSYFTALPSVRLGILTDGIRFEFFTDCENPNLMDCEPFITLDLERLPLTSPPGEVIDAVSLFCRDNFDPETIAEAAEWRLVSKRVRSALMQEVRDPSDKFCRLILEQIGLKNIRTPSIRTRYSLLIRDAYEEALVVPVLERLRSAGKPEPDIEASDDSLTQRIITTDRELAVYRYVCRRLAYLATDETQFSAIERVQYRDYVGKFVVYFGSVRKGRLFEFVEGGNGYDKFNFPAPFGEIETNTMRDIDGALGTVFAQRVRELNTGIVDAKSAAVA